MDHALARTTFATSRLLEFFTESELAMQIGHDPPLWPAALLKELIDNSLDACEKAHLSPHIQVSVEEHAFSVQDNGPGLCADTLRRSLEYDVRVSDKTYYASPTRGRLGNALKCVWAAPFVVDGRHGLVEVAAQGRLHRIDVSLDAIEQKPVITVTEEPSDVKTGTFFRLRWPQAASCLGAAAADFYKARRLVQAYALFNPHATFEFRCASDDLKLKGSNERWSKWRPNWPTSTHWYTPERFRLLIAAYLAEERRSGQARTVREFVAEFDGLTGSRKQKAVLEQAGLSGPRLRDLDDGKEANAAAAQCLLDVLQRHTRPVQPSRLGLLGAEHLTTFLVQHYQAHPALVRYKKKLGMEGGVPFVVEAAFAIKEPSAAGEPRDLLVGLNCSPALEQPLPQLDELLAEMWVDCEDPVVVAVHLSHPCLQATDRGKGRCRLDGNAQAALEQTVRLSTRDWKKLKRQVDRDNRLAERDLEQECRRRERDHRLQIKEAAYQVMEQAYLQTSDPGPYPAASGRLPAEARQIMYAARPLVLALTGGAVWKQSDYFTQHLLPDYLEQHPQRTADWDVVFDARGALQEPHTGRRVPLGTVDVREYIDDWREDVPDSIEPIQLGSLCPTSGPHHRYQFALFVEKQGFDDLLAAGGIAQRYDLAVMSTKGMSVTAARRLVDELSARGVTILVLRDFDKSGFSIVHTLRSDTRRYHFHSQPRVIDLGLRLPEAQELGLQSELVRYRSQKDPRERLRECGATEAECQFLVQGGGPGHWWGARIELNALTAASFLQYLERQLQRVGVRKVVPPDAVVHSAYRRIWRLELAQEALNAALARSEEDLIIPAALLKVLRRKLKHSALSWDQALHEIVREQRQRPLAG
jgi:DNA topoisomerase VI subunit B